MPDLHPDDFEGRYAMCPLCKHDNVPLVLVSHGRVVFEEHPIPLPVGAHPAPVDPGARFNPRGTEATWARVRCPVSGSPLMERIT